VVAIDARWDGSKWVVYTHGGRKATEKELFSWAAEVERRGAGELLFTSMDHDGTKEGFANEALARLADTVSIPIIASGGAGTMPHFKDTFTSGKADAALAASIFHFKEIGIPELKSYLLEEGIEIRK
ncbi:MAG: HisA/HisF-related TIM barrel protein, partial [Cyclobacteriaceae bacterium]|nr:HisA/HisF-related TIM barrel protein [Cyclobacteriaceae bacterium]